MAIHSNPDQDERLPQINLSRVINSPAFEPAPTIQVHMSALNRHATAQALPDSGAGISVAGNTLLQHLHEHAANLLPSNIITRMVKSTKMHPIGKLPVTLLEHGTSQTTSTYTQRSVGYYYPGKLLKGSTSYPNATHNPWQRLTPTL